MSENISPREANAKRWRETLAEQAASGQSIRVYCAERQINRHTFQYWREKFSSCEQKVVDQKQPSRFIAVARNDCKLGSPHIALPNGVTIDLGDRLDSNAVNQFLLNLCGVGLSGGTDAKS